MEPTTADETVELLTTDGFPDDREGEAILGVVAAPPSRYEDNGTAAILSASIRPAEDFCSSKP